MVVSSQSCPKFGPTDLTVLTIGSAPSKQYRSAPEAFRAGHYKDLTETGNRARKVSGTQGNKYSVVIVYNPRHVIASIASVRLASFSPYDYCERCDLLCLFLLFRQLLMI